MRAWTSDARHFGNVVSLRVESAHSAFKSVLVSSRSDVAQLGHRLQQRFAEQLDNFLGAAATDSTRWPMYCHSDAGQDSRPISNKKLFTEVRKPPLSLSVQS